MLPRAGLEILSDWSNAYLRICPKAETCYHVCNYFRIPLEASLRSLHVRYEATGEDPGKQLSIETGDICPILSKNQEPFFCHICTVEDPKIPGGKHSKLDRENQHPSLWMPNP